MQQLDRESGRVSAPITLAVRGARLYGPAAMPPPNVTNLASAVANMRDLAVATFSDALLRAKAARPTDPDPKIEAKKVAIWEAEVAKAKAQMATALQQLVQADVLDAESEGRKSYLVLVKLIDDTHTALTNLMNNTGGTPTEQGARAQLLTALAALLKSLADIAPLALWPKNQTASPTG